MFNRNARPNAGLEDGPLAVIDEAPGPEQPESAGDAETGSAPDEQPWWTKYGATEEAAAEQIRNIDSLRGRQADELGRLRRENAALKQSGLGGEEDGQVLGPPNLAAIVAELDTRFLEQLEQLAGALAQAVDERVGAVESKVDALIRRFAQETAGFPRSDLDA
jgi:hypothetical protein